MPTNEAMLERVEAKRLSPSAAAAFALAIFTSAFLLFLVQPLIAKFILPWFGGSPGVWTTCLMFFQLLLLAGYAYAHLSIRLLSVRSQVIIHILLLAAAAALLPIAPGPQWKPPPLANPAWRILALLSVCLGAPYFILSSTGPLLQAWVSRLNGGSPPYRLYALSNLGSLLALLAYPFIVEPHLSRHAQAIAWSWGLIAFILICATCAVILWKQNATPHPQPPHPQYTPTTWTTRLLWLVLPACASLLLLAVNNVICREIASAPFLWVLPLAIYLLSFIICFDRPRWYARSLFIPAWIASAVGVLWVALGDKNDIPIMTQVAIYCALLFTCCMICHGELARRRPDASGLTGFYLAIAAGGALGGTFVAVIAPLIFRGYWELSVGIIATMALLLVATALEKPSWLLRPFLRPIWLGLGCVALALAFILASFTAQRIDNRRPICQVRSFYGVMSIYDQSSHNLPRRVLYHGGINHGQQLLDPAQRMRPTSYYGPNTGLAMAFNHLPPGPRRIGVVGLGSGSIAVHARKGDTLRFYEIDPQVEQLARRFFTFLSDTPARTQVVLGDARLSLESEPPQNFDLLVLDAFSGDAVPVHLLTKEAVQIYLPHLTPRGILAIHISNRHLDLQRPLRKLAEYFSLRCVLISSKNDDRAGEFQTDWLLLSRHDLGIPDQAPAPKPSRMWTDDNYSLLDVLR